VDWQLGLECQLANFNLKQGISNSLTDKQNLRQKLVTVAKEQAWQNCGSVEEARYYLSIYEFQKMCKVLSAGREKLRCASFFRSDEANESGRRDGS